jgi:hypothetical protein
VTLHCTSFCAKSLFDEMRDCLFSSRLFSRFVSYLPAFCGKEGRFSGSARFRFSRKRLSRLAEELSDSPKRH